MADHFQAAYESVRPVPRVTIDFGDGRKLERTLRGNVATWLCAPDGRVLDVVPGLCDPQTFLRRLQQASALADLYATDRAAFEHAYARMHRASPPVVASAPHFDFPKSQIEGALLQPPRLDVSKLGVELPALQHGGLVESKPAAAPPPPDLGKTLSEARTAPRDPIAIVPARALTDRELLQLDSDTNRATRDPLVHALLFGRAWTPHALDRRLFRAVLHVDLDDPWLGLADGPFGGGAYEGFDRVEPR